MAQGEMGDSDVSMVFWPAAEKVYAMEHDELERRIQQLRDWPSFKKVDRLLGVEEALRRLADPAMQVLVEARAAVVVESGPAIYVLRTLDIIWGEERAAEVMTGLSPQEKIKIIGREI